MNVEIGAEAALFPEKDYISRIFNAVRVYRCSIKALLDRHVQVQHKFQ